jgi:predicted Zn-dependent protease
MDKTIIALFMIAGMTATVCGESSPNYRLRLNQTAYQDYQSGDDVKAEIAFGRELSARVLGNYSYFDHIRLNHYVNLVGQSLLKHSNRPELTYYFAVLDTDTVNAYSAPGGYVFVTLGALKLMNNESELAGVLAHEIAHITQRHIVDELHLRAVDRSAVTSFAAIIGGTTKSVEVAFAQAVDKAAEILFKKGFKIEQEKDVDIIATMMLASAGYDPYALYKYLRKVGLNTNEQNEKTPSTHPLTKERLAAIHHFVMEEKLSEIKSKSLKMRFVENVNFNE